jgi:hypothetical protein
VPLGPHCAFDFVPVHSTLFACFLSVVVHVFLCCDRGPMRCTESVPRSALRALQASGKPDRTSVFSPQIMRPNHARRRENVSGISLGLCRLLGLRAAFRAPLLKVFGIDAWYISSAAPQGTAMSFPNIGRILTSR